MPGYRSNAFATSSVGSATEWNSGSAAPALRAARFIRSIVSEETRRAPGWGQNTHVFPPATIEMPLLMMVSLGFVTGVITAITP